MVLLLIAALSSCLVFSSTVVEPEDLRGQQFESVGFPLSRSSLPPPLINVSVHWLFPHSPRSECKAETLGASAAVNISESIALAIVLDINHCFPEVMAAAAAENGFALVMFPTKYKPTGY
jgi:hypothetical protein